MIAEPKKGFNVLDWLFLVPVLVLGFFLFLKPTLFGFDTFSYLGSACYGFVQDSHSSFFYSIVNVFGCNLVYWKVFSLLILGVCSFFVVKIAKLFSEKFYWLSGLLIFLSFFWGFKLLTLEPESVAWPFLFGSLYFFFKSNGKLNRVLALSGGLWLIAFVFWKGAAYFLLGLVPLYPVLVLPALGLAWIEPGVVWANLLWLSRDLFSGFPAENLPVVGVLTGLFLLPGVFRLQEEKRLFYPFLVFLVLGLLNAKFFFPAAVFLAVNLARVWGDLPLLKFKFFVLDFRAQFLGFLVIILLVSGVGLFFTQPSSADWGVMKEVVGFNPVVQNDPQIGVLLLGVGGRPVYPYWPADSARFVCDSTRPVLTMRVLDLPFVLVKDYGMYKYYVCPGMV